jgi:hypothetical protein
MCSLNPVPSQWGVVLHRLPPGHCVWVGGGVPGGGPPPPPAPAPPPPPPPRGADWAGRFQDEPISITKNVLLFLFPVLSLCCCRDYPRAQKRCLEPGGSLPGVGAL